MPASNPLEALLVEETQPANLQDLAALLKPYILIDKKSGQIELLTSFRSLPNDLKLLIYLSGAKARALLKIVPAEKLSPVDIIHADFMPEGSVKNTLKKLYDAGEIKAESRKYYLPAYRIQAVKTRLESN